MRAHPSHRVLLVALVVTFAISSASCVKSDAEFRAEAIRGSQVVTFRSTDGISLSGRVFGRGRYGVVLSHMLPADQSSWYEFARKLADQGFLVLTYDFRGYCPGGNAGCSDGSKSIAAIWQDVLGAVNEIRSRGALAVSLVGASMGGTASLIAATKTQVESVITLSAPEAIGGLSAGPEVIQAITSAKLFIAGDADTSGAATAAQRFYDESIPPKRLEDLPSEDHGTDLLSGNQGTQVQSLLIGYLNQFGRRVPGSPAA